MRTVFMGTPQFAADVLRTLLGAHEVAAVYTQPDRPRGRGATLVPSPAKLVAEDAAVPVEQPTSLRDPVAAARLAEYGPEVVVVAAYGLVLPAEILEVPSLGCVNVHASLMPRHRGAAPVERAILDGDTETGVSIMRVEEGLDTGPVAETVRVPMDALNATELTSLLAKVGSDALLRVLDRIEDGSVRWEHQTDSEATYAAKVSAADVALTPVLHVADAERRVRASGPSAPSRAVVAGHRVIVTQAHPVAGLVRAGDVDTSRGLELGLADGVLAIDRLIPEGKREMAGADWLRGARLGMPARWSAS